MIRIQLGGTCDPLERLLMQLVQDWDELERWAIKNQTCKEQMQTIREEKEQLLAKIQEIREAGRE